MERALVLSEGKPRIEEGDLPPEILTGGEIPPDDGALLPLAEMERRHILRVLAHLARRTSNRLAGSASTSAD